ncbi:MAG: NAD(P)H-dependent oxidoreductase [Cryobacterium sp.]|nr:NAD(P)H-dependent oxidoreductase [Oligoflexia bacterium]
MKVLIVHSSLGGSESVTRDLCETAIWRLKEISPGLVLTERDLGLSPHPHLDEAWWRAAAKPAAERSADEQACLRLSDDICREVIEADVVMVGVPMWNFSIPSALKAWIDHLVRSGVTFRYGPKGPEGLLSPDKTVFVFEATGGDYVNPELARLNHAGPYIRQIFGFLGVKNAEVITASGTAYRKTGALEEARAEIFKRFQTFGKVVGTARP